MSDVLRILMIDGKDRELRSIADILQEQSGIELRYTRTSEEAELARGAHYHLVIVNMAGDTLREAHGILREHTPRSPFAHAIEMQDEPAYRAKVILVDPTDQRMQRLRSLKENLQQSFSTITTISTVLAAISVLIRHIPDLPQLDLCAKRTLREPPASPVKLPTPKANEPTWPNAALYSGMSPLIRRRFEAFQAQREAAKGI